jgi:L-cysteine S-thiosulfotransferase
MKVSRPTGFVNANQAPGAGTGAKRDFGGENAAKGSQKRERLDEVQTESCPIERSTSMKLRIMTACLLTLCVLPGCDSSPKSERGFRLPDGDAEKGRQAFLALKCHACHKVEGVELPPPNAFNLTLGGETYRVKTYGELVTAIINPSHVLSEKFKKELADAKESPMPKFNHQMTVEQMIDLVAFLQPRYKLVVPERTYVY